MRRLAVLILVAALVLFKPEDVKIPAKPDVAQTPAPPVVTWTGDRWAMASCTCQDAATLGQLLNDGWEPYAVVSRWTYDCVHLFRRLTRGTPQ